MYGGQKQGSKNLDDGSEVGLTAESGGNIFLAYMYKGEEPV